MEKNSTQNRTKNTGINGATPCAGGNGATSKENIPTPDTDGTARNLTFPCRVAKVIRVITVPPVMAATLIVLLRLCKGAFPGATLWVSLFSLAVLPLLSYGIWYAVPGLRQGGRKSQRTVAVICSCLGYIINTVWCLAVKSGSVETVAVLTYLISGVAIAFFSYVCKIKCSGHACGISGPVFTAAVRVHPLFLLGYALLLPVVWSSLKLKRHTAWELLMGTLVPVIAQLLLMLWLG